MRTMTVTGSVVLGGLMLFAAGSAAANGNGFYAALDGGVADYPTDASIRFNDYVFTRTKADASDFAWSLAVGYRFDETFALEAGFVDLGGAHVLVADPSQFTDGRGTVEFAAKGYTLALLAHHSYGNWDPYIKLGAIRSELNVQ